MDCDREVLAQDLRLIKFEGCPFDSLSSCIKPLAAILKYYRFHCLFLIGQDDTMIAVSLGYTCHLTMMISHVLDIPLRFPMELRGSRSLIKDHIHTKLADKDRE